MRDEKYSLDSNILIYSVDSEAGEKQEQAIEILDRIRFFDCVLTLQSLSEFFNVVTRKRRMPFEDAAYQVADWQIMFPVVSAEPKTLRKAMEMVRFHQLSFWDSMLWATCHQAKITRLLSEDFHDGFSHEGLQIQNPFKSNPFDI
jgi:predicted nucleic acid-binding protein